MEKLIQMLEAKGYKCYTKIDDGSFIQSKPFNYSSMRKNGLYDYWMLGDIKEEESVVIGLYEANKGATLIYPRPKVDVTHNDPSILWCMEMYQASINFEEIIKLVGIDYFWECMHDKTKKIEIHIEEEHLSKH